MILCLILMSSLIGCGTKAIEKTDTLTPQKSEHAIEQKNEVEKTLDEKFKNDKSKKYTNYVAFANWTDNSKLYTEALNTETMTISSVQHLPIYKFDTVSELNSFKSKFSDILTMDSGLDEAPSFDYITTAYNDRYFSEKSVILTYIPSGSGSYRFGVSDVYCDGQSLCVYIEQLNNPDAYDCMMSGWFAVVEVDKDEIADCTSFDAQLGTPLG